MENIKGFELNRKIYNSVRKMDHNEMKKWAESIFQTGYEKGRMSGLTVEEIRKAVVQVKGIGENKADLIAVVMESALREKCSKS